MTDQTTVSCPVCGHSNAADATVCGACAFALSHLSPEEKVDAILEDLLDLSKGPMAEAKPEPPPAPGEPDVEPGAPSSGGREGPIGTGKPGSIRTSSEVRRCPVWP